MSAISIRIIPAVLTLALAGCGGAPVARGVPVSPAVSPTAPSSAAVSVSASAPAGVAATSPAAGVATTASAPGDPGADPVFARDADLRRTETYVYRHSEPGDHRLAAGTLALRYDVTTHRLKAELAARKAALAGATGIALYLSGGTALTDSDLAALQQVHRDLGLTNLSRLYVYNLRTIQGGVACTPDSGLACAGRTARGGTFPYLWFNGWWDSWVRHLVLDDLTAVPDGAFSNHGFADVSLRAARTIGVMGFGHGPYAKLSVLYLPSVTTVGRDAFRRNQYLTKVNLPRATRVDDYAFDDASRLRYFTAPRLTRLGRNALNDSHALVAVNLPRLRYLGINCFDLNGAMTVLRLPAVTEIDKNAIVGFARLRTLYLPLLRAARDDSISGDPALTRVVFGARPPVQGARVFTGSPRVQILHTGGAAAWAGFVPSGITTLPVRSLG
ncbi:leucine-rich repeat protein [Actinoplanes sp. L3-i22]|uniref:leucine-rich repeat protein n=1 Tax=Actinoplanes sp. L3-i22 TaxID=2836373 RepID=UPI001C76105D|nr:leucine-rich repeat protein [Actinoplanes sp. L3-i22]BCY08676.1 hypothetical protein L3i22_037640 [Actinoplanes sp. L3-i22]